MCDDMRPPMGSAFYIILKGDVMSVVNIEDTFVEMTELVYRVIPTIMAQPLGDKYCDIAGAVSAQLL